MSMSDTDWRPALPKTAVEEDFADLERGYLQHMAATQPEFYKDLEKLIAKHNPPKLTKAEVSDLPMSLFRQGVSQPIVDLVRRMIKELGLE